ncbi:MAG TPA: DUF951 domain-containing protein [Clostridiaceae bacterium]|nr:DUF951 domain-containing protein [Clostridiaceae bacterium]
MSNKFARYPYVVGMKLELRKKHPCGGRIWTVLRIGADARLKCDTCGHQVSMPRRALEKATKDVLADTGGNE